MISTLTGKMMLKNRYSGRNSSLSLFVPKQSRHHAKLKKYFSPKGSINPLNSVSPLESGSSPAEICTPNLFQSRKQNNSTIIFTKKTTPNQNAHISASPGQKSVKFNLDSEPICDLDDPVVNQPPEYYHPYVGANLVLPELPPLSTAHHFIGTKEFQIQLQKKCELCSMMCNFNYFYADQEAKKIKRVALLEILKIFDNTSVVKKLSKDSIDHIFKMVLKNLERPLAVIDPKNRMMDSIPAYRDHAMEHLEIVYQILTKMYSCFSNRRYVDLNFVIRICRQIGSMDADERQFIVNFVLAYFGNNEDEDLFILLSNLLVYNHESGCSPYSISPILVLMYHVFQAYNEIPPLFDEILKMTVLPLLSDNYEPMFNTDLTNFLNVYVSRKPRFALEIINAIYKYQPRTRNSKQCCFLKLLTSIVPHMYPRDVSANAKKIFQLYAENCKSFSNKVVLCALKCLCDPTLELMITDNSRTVIPIVFKPISDATSTHWSSQVKDMGSSTLIYLRKMNMKCYKEISEETEPIAGFQNPKMQNWSAIVRAAVSNDHNLNLSTELMKVTNLFTIKPRVMGHVNIPKEIRRRSCITTLSNMQGGRAPVL
ncbi:hypothetical protein TRFO_00921 [Tritrichomonas foetus]|uniref:Phosphoprotein phosphatase n=1 Tax=Tritrichomonas foetus TaxID=1144522 RepID=A0A1J4L6R7_9EUKA|nr:hypothetical protein TRFO_00921 [Tritrichomonas foetus]|eukprot:OHT17645.1 hypothetical protein TRFO_00921 [Tritrichomonas foetus]